MGKRALAPLASLAKPGQLLNPQDLGTPGDHFIVKVTPKGKGGDVSYEIQTTQGTWLFGPTEIVDFPRRPDGRPVDWRDQRTPPLPRELAVHDVLPPQYRKPDPNDPGVWEEDLASWDEDNKQVVTAVRYESRRGVVIVMTHSSARGMRRWVAHPAARIVFPRPKDLEPETAEPASPRRITEAYGPYEHPGGYAYVARHPSGRGRWPKWIEQPVKIASDVWLTRPPKTAWPAMVGHEGSSDRWLRHPSDPAWGVQDATIVVPAEEYERVTKIYEDYAKREASR